MGDDSSLRAVMAVEPMPVTFPWEIADRNAGDFIRLFSGTKDQDIGLIVATMILGNYLSDLEQIPKGKKEVLAALLKDDELVLDGGIQAIGSNGLIISPTCCCGLEEWRRWYDVKPGSPSPWLGHDPWGWVEYEQDKVRIWADSEISGKDMSKVPRIDMSWDEYSRAMKGVVSDLREFTDRLETWMLSVEPGMASMLAKHFWHNFGIVPGDA